MTQKIKNLLITLLVGIVITFLIMLSFGIFEKTNSQEIMKICSDSFFISGIVFAGVGGLLYVSNEGVFDGLFYTFVQIGRFFSFRKDLKKKDFYKYKEERSGKIKTFLHLVIVGGILILIAVLFAILAN